MQDENQKIVQLLTEIRDDQREEIAYRKRIMDESMRLQRSAIRWQRSAALFGFLVILGAIAAMTFVLRAAPKREPQDLPPATAVVTPLVSEMVATL